MPIKMYSLIKTLQTILIILVLGIGQVVLVAHATEVKLTASDAAAGDEFGHSVSISGDYVIVGAHGNDDAGSKSGSAYIFYRNQGGSNNWGQQAKLTASDATTGDWFGGNVSISGDYVIVAAHGNDDDGDKSGSAYIFEKPVDGWRNMTETVKLTASDAAAGDRFGSSVSISGDYAIVGANNNDDAGDGSGSAYIFYRDEGGSNNWGQQVKLTASDAAASDYFGSVSISGDYVIVGAHADDDVGTQSGSTYSFLRSGSSWSQKAKITASDGAAGDYFGIRVSISGNYTIVGAHNDDHSGKSNAGSAYIYHSIDDLSLPVELSAFTATTSGDAVILKWRTETEVNNLGFNVYRSTQKNGDYIRITFISGAGSSAMPNDYEFVDGEVEAGKTYFYYLEDIDIAGERGKSEIIKVVVLPARPVQPIPKDFRLLQNYPNPFNPDTWIPYELAIDASVTIRIYDVRGQLVCRLDLGEQKAGRYVDKQKAGYWNGKDQTGKAVSSGLYFYMLRAGDFQATRRMAIVK